MLTDRESSHLSDPTRRECHQGRQDVRTLYTDHTFTESGLALLLLRRRLLVLAGDVVPRLAQILAGVPLVVLRGAGRGRGVARGARRASSGRFRRLTPRRAIHDLADHGLRLARLRHEDAFHRWSLLTDWHSCSDRLRRRGCPRGVLLLPLLLLLLGGLLLEQRGRRLLGRDARRVPDFECVPGEATVRDNNVHSRPVGRRDHQRRPRPRARWHVHQHTRAAASGVTRRRRARACESSSHRCASCHSSDETERSRWSWRPKAEARPRSFAAPAHARQLAANKELQLLK